MEIPSRLLRTATDAIISHLTNIQGSRPAVALLASSIANLVSVQETINTDIRTLLNTERRRRIRTEGRISVLEEKLVSLRPSVVYASQSCGAGGGDSDCDEMENIIEPSAYSRQNNNGDDGDDAASRCKNNADPEVVPTHARVSEPKPIIEIRRSLKHSPVRGRAAHTPPPKQPPVKPSIATETNKNPIPISSQLKRRPQPEPINAPQHLQTSSRPLQRQKQQDLPDPPLLKHVSRKRRRKASDILPTLADTTRHQQQQQQQKRDEKRYEPPACVKCQVRKRADMHRDRGRIDEEVFERWARKPGGCLGFMHMDEPGAPRSPLSFAETETEPPPPATT